MYDTIFYREKELRKEKICKYLIDSGIDGILLSENANLFYTSGRVFNGYTYITSHGKELFFVKRPIGLKGDDVIYIRKPEQIIEELKRYGLEKPKVLALELDTVSYNSINRLKNIFADSEIVNGSQIINKSRAVKTTYEISLLKESGIHHEASYSHVKKIFREGMTDIELQIELERQLRLEGSLGQFRVSGPSMEIFMGNLLCGDNADTPTPYDFAMGGAGLGSSLPVGSNGSIIRPGMSIMVDMGGNFTGYMTDMTRVFFTGKLSELAIKAHNLSIEICRTIAENSHAGTPASQLYETALAMAVDAGLDDYFMGHSQKAGFVGHGVGIEINELPVLSPRSKDILEEGNVIAIEPKFVIPGVGGVGIENTYVVKKDSLECITNFPEKLAEIY